MKKIATISAAAIAATLAIAPVAHAAAPVQTMDVTLTSTKAGTKSKPTVVGATFRTGTKLDDPTKQTLHTIKYAKITLPKGMKLDYKSFPTCTETVVSPDPYTCETSAPKSKIGSGSAKAAFTGGTFDPTGTLTPYIGSNGRLIIETAFDQPATIREGLVGKVSLAGGQYSFDFNVQPSLQIIIQPDTYQQILDFNLKFDKKTIKVGKKTVGLVQLTDCPKGGYVFKGDFQFTDGATATAQDTVACKAAKK